MKVCPYPIEIQIQTYELFSDWAQQIYMKHSYGPHGSKYGIYADIND